MRWGAAILLCALALCSSAPAIAQTSIESVDVPVGLPTVPPASVTPVATPAPAAVATPQPLPSGLGVSSSDWSFQNTPVSAWLDGLANQIFAAFSAIMNKSIQLAQTLFYILAITELGWACGKWAISSTPLEEVVAEAYLKLIRLGLLYLLIGCTFTFPNGSPGWFPSIVGMIIGMAQSASGVSIVPGMYSLNGALNLTAGFSPGEVFTFFWNIAVFVIKSAFTQQSIGNLFVGAFTGATAVWMLTAGLAIVSGLSVMVLGIYTSFKYFATMFKAYMVASQSYLQGFLGSSVTASSGSGLFNAALNLGIEMGALIVIMGVMKSFLTLALNAMNLGFLTMNQAAGAYGPVGSVVINSIGTEGVRLIAILIIDTLVVLWAYLVKTIPEQAAAGITGRLDVRPEEMLAHMRSGSTPIKAASAAGSAIAGGVGVKMLAGSSEGGAPSIMDRAKGAATGAVQGALFAGPEGAIGGALMGAMSAKSDAAQTSGDEGTVSGGSPNTSGAGSSGASSFANREFAPKGGAPKNPTPDQAGSDSSEASADERELVGAGAGAGAGGGRSGESKRAAGGGSVVDGSSTQISHGDDRVEETGGGAAPTASGQVPGEVPVPAAQRANKHIDGSETTLERSAGRVTEAGGGNAGADSGKSSSTGGTDDKATSDQGGKKQGGTGAAAQGGSDNNAMRDLASAMRDNTAALRAHRFGGGAGGAGAGGGSGAPGAGSGSGGGASAGTPSDPIFGGGASPMNPLNLMMYRNLLGGARAPAPRIQPEHPAATGDLSALVK
jgi:hypothetical protein